VRGGVRTKGSWELFLRMTAHLSIYDGQGNLARIGVLKSEPTLLLRRGGNAVFEQPQTK